MPAVGPAVRRFSLEGHFGEVPSRRLGFAVLSATMRTSPHTMHRGSLVAVRKPTSSGSKVRRPCTPPAETRMMGSRGRSLCRQQ